MRLLIPTVALALALPAAASAQDAPEDGEMTAMAETMNDPATQAEMALTMQAMGEILLDMPVGPMMEAMAEMGAEMAGAQARKIDRDATLRRMAPDAGQLPARIAEHTPRMMRAMGAMARGMAAMTPAMRNMARQMEETMGQVLPRNRE